MSKALSDLCPKLQPLANLLLERARLELGFSMIVVDTLRTAAEQQEYLRQGVSRTRRSLHLPQFRCCGKAHAFDAAPAHLVALKNWAPGHPDWERLGALGRSLGLEWGGDWTKFRDCPHFQVKGEPGE